MIKEWENKHELVFLYERVQNYLDKKEDIIWRLQLGYIKEKIIDGESRGVDAYGINDNFKFKHQWIGKYFYET